FPVVARLGSNAGFTCAAVALVAVHASTHLWQPTAEGFRVSSAAYYLPYSLAAALVVGSLALRSRAGIASRPMRFVGRVSYPLYLMHPLALGVAAAFIAPGGTIPELAYLALGLVLSLALAYALHRVVERPLTRVGQPQAARFGTGRDRDPAVVALATA